MSFFKIASETLATSKKLSSVKSFIYINEEKVKDFVGSKGTPKITFLQCTTTAAIAKYDSPCFLNFASAKHPGGGFMRDAIAQEEDVCRKTSLYHSIVNCEEYYEGITGSIYTDRIIYSPHVYVVRDEHFNFIEPLHCKGITCAAPNNEANHNAELLKETFERRIANVLNVANAMEQRVLILGAWGCGAFKNDPVLVANAFKQVISKYDFDELVFAIPDDKNLGVFKKVLM